MRRPGTRARFSRALLAGDIAGGLTGGIASVAGNIATALIAFGPLGAAFSGAGVLAIYVTTILAGAVFVWLRRTPGLQAGISTPIALVIAGVFSSLIAEGTLDPAAASLPQVAAVMILLTGLSAACLVLIWLSGWGRLVPLIPYPVLAGVVNATAVLMVLSQWRHVGGFEQDAPGAWPHPGALLVTAVTALLMGVPSGRLRGVPTVLVGVAGGAAVHAAIGG